MNLEFLARYVWPIVAPFAGRQKRCARCLLSDRAVTLADGVCATCASYLPAPTVEIVPREAELAGLIEAEVVLKGETWDAAVLVSGGKDSAYLLTRLRRDHPELRLLAVTVDNSFMSQTAIANAILVASKNNTDILIISSQQTRFRQELKRAFLGLNKKGCYGAIDFIDGKTIYQVAEETIAALGIKNTMSGLSWVQLQHILGSDAITSNAGPTRMIYPLAAWKIDEQEIRKYVRDHRLMAPGSDSPLSSNSDLVPVMGVVDMKNLGYSSFEPEFAQLVREGKTDRKYWVDVFDMVAFLSGRGYLDKPVDAVLAKMGLALEDVT